MSTCSSFTRSYQTLFVSVPQLKKTEVHPRLGETVACAPVSPTPVHTVMHTSAMLPATPVSPTPVHTVMHISAMSHCHAHKCSVTRHTRFPHTCTHCHAHKCSVTLLCTQVQCYPPHPFPPYLYTLSRTQVQCYTVMHTSAMSLGHAHKCNVTLSCTQV